MDRRTPAPRLLRTALLVAAGATAVAAGQAPPFGGEFQIAADASNPVLASRGDGSFVVAWTNADGSHSGVAGQRFGSDGLKIGGAFQINTTTAGYQMRPGIAVDSSGRILAVWDSQVDLSGTSDVYGQRFDTAGAPVGSEFLVNTYTSGPQLRAAVAARREGDFVVTWNSYGQDYSGAGVFAQRLDAFGAPSGGEFQVNVNFVGDQDEAEAAFDRNGNLVIVWDGPDLDSLGTWAQRYDAEGVKRGHEFAINTTNLERQETPRLAFDSHGNFVVVWESDSQDSLDSQGVFGQRFNRSGEKIGNEFQINTETAWNQRSASVAFDRRGDFVVVWESGAQDGSGYGIFGQRFDRLGNRIGLEFSVNTYTPQNQSAPRIVSDGAGFVVAWRNAGASEITGRRDVLTPEALIVDSHGIGITDLNGVLEPGEAAAVEPRWGYRGASKFTFLSSSVSGLGLTGPAGPTYTLLDGAAQYPQIPQGSSASCYKKGDTSGCFAVQIGGARPAMHWDATLQEDLSTGGSHFWKLHLGDSFSDVPRTQPFYKKIETLLHHEITSGCTQTQYCPGTAVSRDQMAIFIAKVLAGAGVYVPTSGLVGGAAYKCAAGGTSLFTDVATTAAHCRHVHYLAADNVTLGCSPTTYCPAQPVTRDAMASFIAKAIVAPKGGAGVPVSFTGPSGSYSCDAGSPDIHFTDVPATHPFCKHIHYLWANGIVTGCSATQYCPADPVTRDAMAKFIANGFGLELYGP